MQLILRCALSTGLKEWELTVGREMTVAECRNVMVQVAGLEGEEHMVKL